MFTFIFTVFYFQRFHFIFYYTLHISTYIYIILVDWQTNSVIVLEASSSCALIFYKLAPFVSFLSMVQQNIPFLSFHFEINGRQTIVGNTEIVHFLFLKSDYKFAKFRGKLVTFDDIHACPPVREKRKLVWRRTRQKRSLSWTFCCRRVPLNDDTSRQEEIDATDRRTCSFLVIRDI